MYLFYFFRLTRNNVLEKQRFNAYKQDNQTFIMENIVCDNGGCLITWNIENPLFLKPKENCVSPVFNIETNQKTQWRFELYKFENSSFNFWIQNRVNNSNVTISYSVFLKTDYKKMEQKSGLLVFKNPSSKCIYSAEFQENYFPKHLTVFCYLRCIGDTNFMTNQYKFRTDVEVESLRFDYTIPNISTWDKRQALIIPLPLRSDKPEPFEITLRDPGSGSDDYLSIEFTSIETNKNVGFYLHCKLAISDGENNSILKSIQGHEFVKGNEKWVFENVKSINHSSTKDALTLDFEFLISKHNTATWMEDFRVFSNQQIKIVSDTLEKVNLRDDLMCLYLEQKCPDVEICVEGKKFQAHKAILSGRSPVFMAMFENNMQEKEKNVVEISDLDSETVDKMLFFIYSEIMQVKDWGKVAKLYIASDKYQIMSLRDKCSSILKEQLSLKNVYEALSLADMHCDPDFMAAVQDFVIADDEKVFKSDEWKDFMNSNSKIASQTMHKAWLRRSKCL